MPNYDFACPNGHEDFEVRCSIAAKDSELHRCPECREPGHQVITQAPVLCTTIVPMYPGSKAVSAGFQHSHGPRPATKLVSGPGGMSRPREVDSKVAEMYRPDPKTSVKEALKNAGKP
jgi:putative FmdB family regulatory protein